MTVMADDELAALLDISAVVALAGPRSFERGVDYLATGRVGTITASDDAIEATVQGLRPRLVVEERACSRPGNIRSCLLE